MMQSVHLKLLMLLQLLLMDRYMFALADDAKAEAQICNKNRYYGISLISL
jgi:hypothetical protein